MPVLSRGIEWRTTGGPTALLGDARVVDLTDAYGACGRVLAELGAEVVRIEVPAAGTGPTCPPRADDGTGLHHAFRNVGKLVVTLDPLSADDRRTVEALLAGADVAIVSEGWGADDTSLAAAAVSPSSTPRRGVVDPLRARWAGCRTCR